MCLRGNNYMSQLSCLGLRNDLIHSGVLGVLVIFSGKVIRGEMTYVKREEGKYLLCIFQIFSLS